MTKQYELNYYKPDGTSDPFDSVEDVQKSVAAQTGMDIAIEDIREGTMFVHDDGSLMLLSHFEDGFPGEDGFHESNAAENATDTAFDYYEIQCYGPRHPQDFTYYLETEKALLKHEVIQRLTDKFIGVNGLEAHHVENAVAVVRISRQEFMDGCGVDPSPEPDKENNRYEDAIIAIRDHNWSFESNGEGRRKILVPPAGDPRRFWTTIWDDNGFPHWLPEYSVKS